MRDRESKEDFTFPAEYMFKDVPEVRGARRPGRQLLVAEMDEYGIRVGDARTSPTNLDARRALHEHPDRFVASWDVDPNRGMEAVRELEQAVRASSACAPRTCFPAGLTPQVPINDKKFYPIYAKCVELDIPIFVYAGVPGPARADGAAGRRAASTRCAGSSPSSSSSPATAANRGPTLAVKLLLKWPNLYYSTSAFAPKYYPKDIVDFANTRGADKIMYAGYFPMGLSLDRIFAEMPDVPFRDHVWPKFLRENAIRVFKLDESTP